MKLQARNAAWLLPLFLTACLSKPHPTQIQQYAPPVSTVPKPPPLHPELPESALTLPDEPIDTDTDAIVDEAAKPVIHHHPKPPATTKQATETPDTAPAQPTGNTQQAETDSAEIPAIGVLSSGDPSDLRQETTDTIAATELGLKSIDRPLNGQEQKTAAQIRQYLRQAKKALTTGDVEGAHTLAAKAKAVLGELSQ